MTPQNPSFWSFPYVSQRMPLLAENVVSTSQPLASAAGLSMYLRGGNAADAALATAIALTVLEPCQNGIGSDAFALIWADGKLHGLNASGRAPNKMTPQHFKGRETMPMRGWETVTVPGTVSAWRTVSEKFGKLPFADLFEPAIRYATDGYLVSPTVQRQWQAQVAELLPHPGYREAFAPKGHAPEPGERFICPGQARTLTRIAESKGEDFYHGELAAGPTGWSRSR
jgi:gamma-glutamyltranspeptidase/glutathione hydrolase